MSAAPEVCPHCNIDAPYHEQACIKAGGTLDYTEATNHNAPREPSLVDKLHERLAPFLAWRRSLKP